MSKPVDLTPAEVRKSEIEFKKSAETLNASQIAMSIIIKHNKDIKSAGAEAEKSVAKEPENFKK